MSRAFLTRHWRASITTTTTTASVSATYTITLPGPALSSDLECSGFIASRESMLSYTVGSWAGEPLPSGGCGKRDCFPGICRHPDLIPPDFSAPLTPKSATQHLNACNNTLLGLRYLDEYYPRVIEFRVTERDEQPNTPQASMTYEIGKVRVTS
ncbi:hypothetical protein DM02DRAFT_648194 [Periconia macrospinosa]|uniref:Uncharacterized protein n=1 Tax=Periconia macrospinosa TaxID=97972 RepID=A0A2V1EF88_9PLEO|nr:hypothetical protein DM02DRAFT_648194 [Periconia macrospinosa]